MKTLPHVLSLPAREHPVTSRLRHADRGLLLSLTLGALLLAGCSDHPIAPEEDVVGTELEALEGVEGLEPAEMESLLALAQNPRVTTLLYPRDMPGGPYYANLSGAFLPHDGETAGITFVREPGCIPDDFNLLDWLDFEDSFGCTLTSRGVTFWFDPNADPFPFIQIEQERGQVPVWFVAWPELEAAIADGVLTIGELEGLPSLQRGLASRYSGLTFNSNQNLLPPGSRLTVYGRLQDGRSFFFYVKERLINGVNVIQDIEIDFN